MSWLLGLIAVVSAGHWASVDATCSWKQTLKSNIAGGVYTTAATLSECQAACLSSSGCVSVDWNPTSKWCWLLKTQAGVKYAADIDHYDYVCTVSDPCSPNPCQNGGQCRAGTNTYSCTCSSGFTGTNCQVEPPRNQDLTQNVNIQQCLTSNYKGIVTDLYALTSGASWTFDLPFLRIPWPGSLLGNAIKEIRYTSATNLAYLRAKIIDSNGQVHLTEPITTTSYKVQGVNSVREVFVYFAPNDFRQNVTVDGFDIIKCDLFLPLLGCTATSSVFSGNGILDLLSIVTLGILQFSDGGGIRWSGGADLPFIDVDLNCLGVGPSEFFAVGFGGITNIKYGIVKIWSNEAPVTVFNIYGTVSSTYIVGFDSASSKYGIWFGQGIRGDRIRLQIVPGQIANQDTSVKVWFKNYFVLIR